MRRPTDLLLFSMLMCLMVWTSHAHLCLISPRQRGAMDISEGGSHTCFRHGAECGGEPAQVPPKIVLDGGLPLFIKWQQNYNHYSFGFPGYMDLAFAENRSTADGYQLSPFTTLTVVPDPNEYDQANQRNYTAVVTLPNQVCDHCIIRARYVPHKPGETTFYQCADVKIRATAQAQLSTRRGELQLFDQSEASAALGEDLLTRIPGKLRRHRLLKNRAMKGEEADTSGIGKEKLQRALALVSSSPDRVLTTATNSGDSDAAPVIHGIANDLDNPFVSSYLTVDPETGVKSEVAKLNFRVDSSVDPLRFANGSTSHNTVGFVPDGVFSIDPVRGVTIMPCNTLGQRESFPESIVEIHTASGKIVNHYSIEHLNKTLSKSAFSAVLVENKASSLTFSIEPASQEGKYDFVVGRLYKTGAWQMLLRYNQSEDTYVNFQRAEYDVNTGTLYALLGNENDADHLSARIYKFSLPRGYHGSKMSFIDLDVSEFTFMSFHINIQNSNHLWAISPGLHSSRYPAFYLVDVNTDVGSVQKVMQLTPPGIFERYYGGTVAGSGPGETNHQIRHVLRVADTQADVILTVDTVQTRASFSQMTNLRNLRNLVYA